MGSGDRQVDATSAPERAQRALRLGPGLGQQTQPRGLVRRHGETAGRLQWGSQAGHMGMGSGYPGLDQSYDHGAEAEPALRPLHGFRPGPRRDRAGGRLGHRHRRRLGRRLGMGADCGGVDPAPHRQRTQPARGAHVRLAGHRFRAKPPGTGGGPAFFRHRPADHGDLGARTHRRRVHRPRPVVTQRLAAAALGSRHGLLSRHRQDVRIRRPGQQWRVA